MRKRSFTAIVLTGALALGVLSGCGRSAASTDV